ncbi:MAG: HEAT repeat domain-containing protein [Verrucomicrobia bacterium]|nr:HEAT repeat domain-containing protein [Verrucomicrobiota bacterium]
MGFVGLLLASALVVEPQQIAYLVQSKEIPAAIDLYESYYKARSTHDYDLLQRLGILLLEQGVRSSDMETQLLSLYGASIAGHQSSIDILEEGIKSPFFESQIAAVRFLAQLQDDRCDRLLIKAMNSGYLPVRMEAGYQLAVRKHVKAVGQIEALMYRIPEPYWAYFPQFFALMGTNDAISILRHLMENPQSHVRVQAIMNAARYGRDDLLPKIRAHATHAHVDEQEACALALGFLKDSKSIPQLKKLSNAPDSSVRLAALQALHLLGDSEAAISISKLAEENNLFAISLLSDIPSSTQLLAKLAQSKDTQIKFNAAFALLKLRDGRCLRPLESFLIKDAHDTGYQPQVSPGTGFVSWKVVSSVQEQASHSFYDLLGITLHLREEIVARSVELSESDFLHLSRLIFETRQFDLIPLVCSLLENHRSPGAIALLKEKAHTAGAPLIRAYCNLSLLRLKEEGPYEDAVRKALSSMQTTELIQFRPDVPMDMRSAISPHQLTPEESSRFLIEAYQTLADRHDEKGVEILLSALKAGNPKNRYVLAGLLAHALQ